VGQSTRESLKMRLVLFVSIFRRLDNLTCAGYVAFIGAATVHFNCSHWLSISHQDAFCHKISCKNILYLGK
jgi:hypothetical protein